MRSQSLSGAALSLYLLCGLLCGLCCGLVPQGGSRTLRGDQSSPLHTDNTQYVDRYSTCFACQVTLSSSVENKNLYDDSSLAAMLSAIHLIMGEPEDTIIYSRDPEKVCDFTDGVDRPIVQGVINFSITKLLIQPTYTWEFQEMMDSLETEIKNAVTDGSFARLIEQEIDTHNAVLLQYGQFARILSRVTAAQVSVDGVLNTLPRPTIAPSSAPSLLPTLAPTLNISNVQSSHPDRNFNYYARRTAPLYCIGIVILAAVFVLFCVETKSSKNEKAREMLKNKQQEEVLKAPIAKDAPREEEDRARQLPSVCYEAAPEVVNRAFIYIKPHAASVQQLPPFIRNFFASKKRFRVVGEGEISSKWANDGFEKQYQKMYNISFLKAPSEHLLTMTEKEAFFTKFSLTWHAAVQDLLVKNVPDTCLSLGVDQEELCAIWMLCVEKGQMVKLNDSFYCGFIDFVEGTEPVFCINGFFSSIRAEYILYATPMPYFLVEWSSEGSGNDKRSSHGEVERGGSDKSAEEWSWKAFNKHTIGATNPLLAHADSLRANINANWEALCLSGPLDATDNAVHASTSAFAALAERTKWLAAPTFSDPLGYALNMLGVTPSLLEEWFENPVIKGQPIFDHFKNLGCKQSIDVAYDLLIWNTAIKNGMSQEETGKSFQDDNKAARNCAFMYLKPHANTFAAQNFVREFLTKQNLIITLEGDFNAEYISSSACIDKQYATMAEKSLSSPSKLDLSDATLADFETQFGVSWESVVRSEQVLGVAEAAELLELSDRALSDLWLDIVMKTPDKMIKLERSVYCCLIDCIPEKSAFFCINGFFMGMRAEYTLPSHSIHYFLVEWSSDLMDWKKFRTHVIGCCNPFEAEHGSLRRTIATQWLDLRLHHPLDVMDNAIHASSSAFEACIERSIWFKTPLEKDALFGQKLLTAGVPLQTLKEWSFNPKLFDKNIFDYMVNLDSEQCIAKAKVLVQRSSPGPEKQLQPIEPSSGRKLSLSSSAPPSRNTPRQGTLHPGAPNTKSHTKSHRRTSMRNKQQSSSSDAVPPLALGRRHVVRVSPIEEGVAGKHEEGEGEGDGYASTHTHHQQRNIPHQDQQRSHAKGIPGTFTRPISATHFHGGRRTSGGGDGFRVDNGEEQKERDDNVHGEDEEGGDSEAQGGHAYALSRHSNQAFDHDASNEHPTHKVGQRHYHLQQQTPSSSRKYSRPSQLSPLQLSARDTPIQLHHQYQLVGDMNNDTPFSNTNARSRGKKSVML